MTDITHFVNRLKACGFSPDRAALIVDDFLRNFRGSYIELEQFVKSVEGERIVETI